MHAERLLPCAVRRCLPLLLAAATWAFAASLQAADTSTPSTDDQTRAEAIRAIPMDKLLPQDRAKVRSVLSNVSIYRRMPVQVIDCDPTMYLFLVEHPEVVVNIWELMELSGMTLVRTGENTFTANDGQGTTGNVEFLYGSHDTHVVYCQGSYDGTLLNRKINGSSLLLLKTGYVREPNGRYYITCRLDCFINVENVGVDFLARTLFPLMGHVADHNFRETAAFLQTVSATAEANSAGVRRLSNKLSRVEVPVRQKFADVADNVSQRIAADQPEPATEPVPQLLDDENPIRAVSRPMPNFRRK